MAYSMRATAIGYGAGSSVSVTVPASVQVGDFLMLIACGNGIATAPTGWNSGGNWGNANGFSGVMATKTAVSGDAGSTVTVSTSATASSIGIAAVQGPVTYDGLNAGAMAVSTSAGSQGFTYTSTPGDLFLLFGTAFVTGSTFSYTSTNGTVTIDNRDTSSAGVSSVVAHAAASTGSSTQVTASYAPTSANGFLAFQYRVTDYKLSAKAGGAANVTLLKLTAAAGGKATVSINLTVTAVTATVSGAAPTTGVTVATSTPSLHGATALAYCSADVPSFMVDGGDIDIDAETAEVTGLATPGLASVGVTPLGDTFANPYQANGAGGVVTVTTGTFTVETDEPAPVWAAGATTGSVGTVLSNTAWIRYVGTEAGTLTVTGPTGISQPYQIELFEGTTLDSLTRVDGQNNFQFAPDAGDEIPPTLTDVVSANTPVYVRLWPTDPGQTGLVAHVTFAFTADANPGGLLNLDITTPNFSVAPGVIRADIIGGTPGADLVFDLLGTSAAFPNPPGVGLGAGVATYSADTSGNLYGASIPLPTVSAGTYTVRVTDAGTGASADGTLQVQADPVAPPGTIGADNPIGVVSNGTAIKSWVFRDPAPSGLGTYVFTINPTTMTSPHAERNVTIDHLVAPDADQLIWEGAYRASEWRFQGIVLAQADYDAIVGFAQLNRRFWIVDHRDRGWVCSIESIGWTKHHDISNNWAWDYDITALIYDGPIAT